MLAQVVERVVNKAQLQMGKGVASYDNVGAGVGQSRTGYPFHPGEFEARSDA
jgi:hypothetical protein